MSFVTGILKDIKKPRASGAIEKPRASGAIEKPRAAPPARILSKEENRAAVKKGIEEAAGRLKARAERQRGHAPVEITLVYDDGARYTMDLDIKRDDTRCMECAHLEDFKTALRHDGTEHPRHMDKNSIRFCSFRKTSKFPLQAACGQYEEKN